MGYLQIRPPRSGDQPHGSCDAVVRGSDHYVLDCRAGHRSDSLRPTSPEPVRRFLWQGRDDDLVVEGRVPYLGHRVECHRARGYADRLDTQMREMLHNALEPNTNGIVVVLLRRDEQIDPDATLTRFIPESVTELPMIPKSGRQSPGRAS